MKKLFPRSEKLCSEEEDEGEEEDCSLQYVSSGQAADMLEQCLMWYENQTEATATLLMLLKQIRDLAVKIRRQNSTSILALTTHLPCTYLIDM